MDHEEAMDIVRRASAETLEQATNPTITEPTVLDDEALKPMPVPEKPLSLAEKLAAGKDAKSVVEGPKRKPGRPPGRKNNATLLREAQDGVNKNPPARMVTPAPRKTKPDDGLTPQQRHEHKLARADKLTEQVLDSINDNIPLLLMAMGCPPELLYTEGNMPKSIKENSKYTPMAQMLMLDPMQAKFMGRFLAEMEATETGGKLGGMVTDGKGPMVIYGILSLAGILQYGKSLMDAYNKFEPLLEAYKAQQAVRDQQKFNQNQTGG